jgi:hypothetical protein
MPTFAKTNEPAPREPITDSPWLWAALFTGFGLAALLATGGKFGKRQAGIENQYQARAAVASGQLQVEQTGSGKQVAKGAPEYTTPEKVAIPVWPLEIILGAIFAGALYMLLRQLFGGPRPAAPS